MNGPADDHKSWACNQWLWTSDRQHRILMTDHTYHSRSIVQPFTARSARRLHVSKTHSIGLESDRLNSIEDWRFCFNESHNPRTLQLMLFVFFGYEHDGQRFKVNWCDNQSACTEVSWEHFAWVTKIYRQLLLSESTIYTVDVKLSDHYSHYIV